MLKKPRKPEVFLKVLVLQDFDLALYRVLTCFLVGTVCPALYQKKGTILRRESKDRNAKKCGQLQCSMYYDFKTSDLIVHVMQGKW